MRKREKSNNREHCLHWRPHLAGASATASHRGRTEGSPCFSGPFPSASVPKLLQEAPSTASNRVHSDGACGIPNRSQSGLSWKGRVKMPAPQSRPNNASAPVRLNQPEQRRSPRQFPNPRPAIADPAGSPPRAIVAQSRQAMCRLPAHAGQSRSRDRTPAKARAPPEAARNHRPTQLAKPRRTPASP